MNPSKSSLPEIIKKLEHSKRKEDSEILYKLFCEVLEIESKIWQKQILGFGTYHYKYASGREGDWFITGFSPRKSNLSIYFMCGFDYLEDYISKLGNFKIGKSCLYVNKIEDIDLEILKQMIVKCYAKFDD